MGLMEQNLEKTLRLQKRMESGEISHDQAVKEVQILTLINRQGNDFIKVSLFTKDPIKFLKEKNIITTGTTIRLDTTIELEAVKCPEQNGTIITRAECLDYSGTHTEDCQSCDNFKPTRNLLLGHDESK